MEGASISASNYVIDGDERHRHCPDVFARKPPYWLRASVAEKLDGRLAMIGCASLLALEILFGHSLIEALTSLSQT